MSGINCIPQYENLTRLEKVIRDLEELSGKGDRANNRIVKHVDDIIRILNKENPDYGSTIQHIENFLRAYEVNSERFKRENGNAEAKEQDDNEIPKDLTQQEQILEKQNSKLKEILRQKKNLNREIQMVNEEYENNIDNLLELIQEKKFNDETEKFEYVMDVRRKLEKEQQEEADLYVKFLNNEEIIHKLNRVLIESYKIFDIAR